MRILLFSLSFLLVSSPAFAISYLSKTEALKLAFPTADKASSEKKTVSAKTQTEIEKVWGKKHSSVTYKVYTGKKDGILQGYALFLTRGTKYQPITFMVKISPAGQVEMVSVVVYREPRGEEVKEYRFLKQFFGKSKKDKLGVGRGIIAVSGATVSAEVMAMGVKEALLVVDDLYLSKVASTAGTPKSSGP